MLKIVFELMKLKVGLLKVRMMLLVISCVMFWFVIIRISVVMIGWMFRKVIRMLFYSL